MTHLSGFREEQIDYAGLITRAKRGDLLFGLIGLVVMMIAILTLMTLIVDLALDGIPRLSWDFLTNFPSRRAAQAGILSPLVGTTLVMLVTAILAIPLGVMAGLYLEEYAPKNLLTNIIEINVTNLAGVPSIIYGLLALGLFVQTFGMGETILVAGMVLALLILPVVIVATREAIRAVPGEMREAAFALGADKWQTMAFYVLPVATPGILTGAIVGLARAIGETAPIITIGALTFIAFLPPSPIQAEPPFLNFQWLNSPFTVMPIQMFNWVSRPQEAFHINAAATGIVLMGMTLLMNGLAVWLRYRIRRQVK
ncbi:phosphate ABC transporter permease PstA [Telmatospirillum sp. J64-1]|uniref:phosphate ABC transporter permease PstA n=1 Tax=Telmatospirillum sp. J64-1 TaxID=2502183 RepID=UPI00115F408F|nr:phosphate ABC transporter permease PstA [Telmatospirillum sp. J64-1]